MLLICTEASFHRNIIIIMGGSVFINNIFVDLTESLSIIMLLSKLLLTLQNKQIRMSLKIKLRMQKC